jgi:hypothetical protein
MIGAGWGWQRLGHWEKAAVVLWALLLAATFGRGLLCQVPTQRGAYGIYAAAGQNWFEGKPVYTPYFDADSFSYSPPAAAFFAFIPLLPDLAASLLWRALLVVVYLAALQRWLGAALPEAFDRSQRARFFLLLLPLAGPTLVNAQAGALVAGLVLLALADTAEERWNRAALWSVLAGTLKVYPFAVGLLLVVVHPRKFPIRLVAILAVVLAAPFMLRQPQYVLDQYLEWPRFLRIADASPWYRGRFNCDLQLLLSAWARPLDATVYRGLELLLATGAAAVCLACRRAGWEHKALLTVVHGLSACWMTVFGPAAESFTFILLGPTLASLLVESGRERRPLPYQAALAASWGLLLAVPMAMWTPWGSAFRKLGPHPAAGLLLLGCLLGRIVADFRTRSAVSAEPARPTPWAA